jgi:hypothetical protein
LAQRIGIVAAIRNHAFRLLPRAAFGSRDTASASVTSLGEALSSRTPNGRPSPSTSTIHFVPLPRLVFPTAAPFFAGAKLPSRKASSPFQQSLLVQRPQQPSPSLQPYSFVLPLLEPPPARRGRRKLVGQKPPRRARLEDAQDAFETSSVRRWRAASPVCSLSRRRKQSFYQLPLLISQQLLPVLHDRSSTLNLPHT